MTFWTWIFSIVVGLLLVPLAWAAGKAVGMERATLGRAALFAICESAVGVVAIELVPFDMFILKALAALFGALLASPLFFRALMTSETARALLASLLLAVAGVALSVLFLLL